MFRVSLLVILYFLGFSALKANDNTIILSPEEIQVIIDFQEELAKDSTQYIKEPKVKFKRGKAIILTVFTGFLGGHRIYFGTHHRTPIIYSITFGGLGILPLIDLAHIIFTKDLSKYQHKTQVIMWGK